MFAAARFSGIFMSTDSANSWQLNSALLTTAKSIRIDALNPDNIYVALSQAVNNTFMYHSNDAGNTWNPVIPGFTIGTPLEIEINPENSSILYAATADGFSISTDSGKN